MSVPPWQRLTAAETAEWLSTHPDALLLDARQEPDHAAGHVPGSLRLDGRNHERLLMSENRARPVFIYCYHGNASQTYAQMFVDFGFRQVHDLIGGYEAWELLQSRPMARPLDPTLAEWLASNGFEDVNARGAHANTPLMQAAWKGEREIVDALMEAGADLLATNGDGNNALWLACVSNDPALVKRLAQAGVPIDHANLTGATALMYAASSSKPEIVRTLIGLSADAALTTQDGFTALDMAASLECLQLLRPKKADTD